MWAWLTAPIDPGAAHSVGFHLSWHARFMVLAWGVLVPLGVLFARYFKITPGQKWPDVLDNRFWWVMHRSCQYGACVLMIIGLWFVLMAPSIVAKTGPHAIMGWAVLTLAVVQIAGGLLRGTKGGPAEKALGLPLRGDHFDMTRRRLVFEYIHKAVGYLALGVSAVTILIGLWQANAPNWMWLCLSLWWLSLALAATVLQKRGMAVDTYHAIWGPDPELPGNKRKPIGLGIKKSGPSEHP
jgi:hypothetical protein